MTVSKTDEVMLEVVLRDVASYWKSRARGAYTFKRDKITEKGMPSPLRREHDALFARQRAEADAELQRLYEERVIKYGGNIEQLPWRKAAKAAKAAEAQAVEDA
jgi:hypothetical protein